jgi:hypothetical protein
MKSRGRTKTVSLAALSFLLLAFVMAPATVRYFTVEIAPDSANGGETQSYTITITNDETTTSTQKLGSATIDIPTGFTGVSLAGTPTTDPAGKTWAAAIVGSQIQLEASGGTNRLVPTESVSVTFQATAPNPATVTVYTWITNAYADTPLSTGTLFGILGDQPTVTVTPVDSFVFAGWRPPVINHLDDENWDGWQSGSTMPVKFLVVDEDGNPVIAGVVATVKIGDSDEVPAVLDDAEIGQWIAEVVLVGSGIQDVTITGNVTDVTPLSILVKENP